jgi:hypothetical protein
VLDSARIAAIVPVSDVNAAVEFYEGVVGLRFEARRRVRSVLAAQRCLGMNDILPLPSRTPHATSSIDAICC